MNEAVGSQLSGCRFPKQLILILTPSQPPPSLREVRYDRLVFCRGNIRVCVDGDLGKMGEGRRYPASISSGECM